MRAVRGLVAARRGSARPAPREIGARRGSRHARRGRARRARRRVGGMPGRRPRSRAASPSAVCAAGKSTPSARQQATSERGPGGRQAPRGRGCRCRPGEDPGTRARSGRTRRRDARGRIRGRGRPRHARRVGGDLTGELGERRRTGEHRTGDPVQPAGAEFALTGHGDEARPFAGGGPVGFEHDDRGLEDSRRGGVEPGRLHVDDRVLDSG